MKRYLMITRVFPPKAGGGVPRMANFAQRLRKFGWEATIITPAVIDGWIDTQKEKSVAGLDIERVGEFSRESRSLKEKIKGRIQPIDPSFAWAREVWNTLKSRNLSKYEIVLTSSPPHSVHYVGKKIATKFGLKWIADFRDPFTLNAKYRAYTPLHAILDKAYENNIYQVANRIITNTRINRRDIITSFPKVNPKKFITINNGFEPSELSQARSQPLWNNCPPKKINYIYLGGMYGPDLDSYFFDGLSKALQSNPKIVEEMAIRIFGDTRKGATTIKPFVNRGIVSIHEPIPANKIGEALAFADAGLCWLPGQPKDRGRIPQKFFEYFGSKTPVFFVGRPDGEIGNICRRFQIGITVNPVSAASVAKEFLRFHELIKQNKITYRSCPNRLFDQFNRGYQASKLANIFSDVISQDSGL